MNHPAIAPQPRVRADRVCLAKTDVVKAAVKTLKDNDCRVEADYEAGTVKAFDGEATVYMAIQKGRGQPWIVSCYNTQRIQWHC